jgi:hypothetical protein
MSNRHEMPLRKSDLGLVPDSDPISAAPRHFGRSLLWSGSEPEPNVSANSSSTMCPMFFNQVSLLFKLLLLRR